MEESLYQKLIKAEQFKELWEAERRSLSLNFPELPEIDTAQIQRDIFEQYKDNPVLQAAVRGEKTVEQNIDELAVYNRDLRRFLPRRKNKEHNQHVQDIEKLVSVPLGSFTAQGVYVPDNFFTFSAVTGLMVYGFTLLFSSGKCPDTEMVNDVAWFTYSYMMALGGLPLTLSMRKPMSQRAYEEARYIDKKIKELDI